MTKAELIELAERCERAEGADRELDATIVTTLCPGATVSEYICGEGDDIVFHAEPLGIRNKDCCPWYTHSLDAALTLVPKGCFFRAGHDGDGADPSLFAALVFEPLTMREPCSAVAETPALAICAAALRARASMMGDEA